MDKIILTYKISPSHNVPVTKINPPYCTFYDIVMLTVITIYTVYILVLYVFLAQKLLLLLLHLLQQ